MPETIKKTRKHFSNQFKRRILLEYAKNKDASKVFLENGIDFTGDKKYALKLIHKWKNEMYKNINMLSCDYFNLDLDYIEKEIEILGNDSEKDDIVNEILIKNKSK